MKFIFAFLLPFLSFAATHTGVEFPDTATVSGKTLQFNGAGLRTATFLKVKVYVGALYLEQKTKSDQEVINGAQTKKVVLNFLRSVSAGDIADGMEKAMKTHATNYEAIKPSIEKLKSWIEPLQENEKMEYEFFNGNKSLRIFVKGKEKGVIEDKEFNEATLRGWFSEKAEYQELRKGMLGMENA